MHPHKKERTSCRNARNATKPPFWLGSYHFAANTHITKNNLTERKVDAKIDGFRNLDQNLVLEAFRRRKTHPKMAPRPTQKREK